jgi:hypothetical protein
LWQLAESLRNYRDRANLTIEKAGTLLKPYSQRWSRSKVQRIETRLYAPTPAEVEHMVDVYNVPATEAPVLVEMAREARQRGWWQASAFPKHFQSFVGLEQVATTMRQFELALLPGLLQTSDYARALMMSIEDMASPDVLERLVAARMARQHVLTRPTNPVTFHVILNEAVLRCPVGSKRVMRGQLERLLEAPTDTTADLTIRIVPFSAGPHPGMEGAFTILTLPDLASDFGFVEGTVGSVYLEDQDDVRRCTMRFAVLSRIALPAHDSAKLISTILTEYQ